MYRLKIFVIIVSPFLSGCCHLLGLCLFRCISRKFFAVGYHRDLTGMGRVDGVPERFCNAVVEFLGHDDLS